MKGGTYSEAVNAGFTSDQAGLLARLSIDTKNEALDLVRDYEKGLKNEVKFDQKFYMALGFLAGFSVGMMAILIL